MGRTGTKDKFDGTTVRIMSQHYEANLRFHAVLENALMFLLETMKFCSRPDRLESFWSGMNTRLASRIFANILGLSHFSIMID